MRDSRALSLTHPSSSPSPYPPPPFYLYPPASHRRLSPLFSSFPIYLSSMSSTGHCFLTPNYINSSLLFALSHCLCLPVSCLIARPLSDSVCLCLRLCMSMSLSLVYTVAASVSFSLPASSFCLARALSTLHLSCSTILWLFDPLASHALSLPLSCFSLMYFHKYEHPTHKTTLAAASAAPAATAIA
jgi:hypothetical protein